VSRGQSSEHVQTREETVIRGTTLRLSEAIVGAFVLAIGLFIAIETFEMASTGTSALVGPHLFPYLVGFGLIAIGLSLLKEAVTGHVAHETGFELDWRAVAFASGALILQMLLLERIGWILASTLMFVLTTLAFRERRVVVSVLIGLVLTSLTFGIFNYGLGLGLPTGSVIEDLLAGSEEGE
jgi:putative tricarboxylic transport membrane protein